MIHCLYCQAETSNGLALCERCRASVLVDLEFIPIYFRNLARWRPGRAGSRPVPASRPPAGLGYVVVDLVSEALDEAGADLSGWARCLVDDRRGITLPTDGDDEAATATAVCAFLAEHLTSIATLEWVGELVASAAAIETRLRGLTEQVVPGWYAGACRKCESATYVVPGLTWVTCRVCGTTTYARDHLEIVLAEARDWVARPMRIAEAVVALMDTEMSVPRLHKRISKWGERGEDGKGRSIPAVRKLDADGDSVGPKRYRLGDVLDALLADGATRLNDQFETSDGIAS